jgi:hypothetical protein
LKLLLDEMYSPKIAERLRELGHDAFSAQERDDLRSLPDSDLFVAMGAEKRTIVTNNVRDFMPLVSDAMRTGSEHYGILFTSDKSLPRRRDDIQTYVELLDRLLRAQPGEDALLGGVRWLP